MQPESLKLTMGKDKRGVARGKCNACDCEEFEVEDQAHIKCDYCGHPPGQHEIVATADETSSNQATSVAVESCLEKPEQISCDEEIKVIEDIVDESGELSEEEGEKEVSELDSPSSSSEMVTGIVDDKDEETEKQSSTTTFNNDIDEWNSQTRAFSLEDKQNFGAITSYQFSITVDKRSHDKTVVVCACSACKTSLDIGKYPIDAKTHGITNLGKHRETTSHKYHVEKAAGRRGVENSVAAALYDKAEELAGKNVFLLKEGFLQCRLCTTQKGRITLFGQGSAETRIRSHVESNPHKEKEKLNGKTVKNTNSMKSYFKSAK